MPISRRLQEHKAIIVAELRKRAAAGQTITYGELGKLVGMQSQGPWRLLLDAISADERTAGRPNLACLAVTHYTGFPSYVGPHVMDREAALSERMRVFDALRPRSSITGI